MGEIIKDSGDSRFLSQESFNVLSTNRLNIIGCGFYLLFLLLTEIAGVYWGDESLGTSTDMLYWFSVVISIVYGSAFIKFHVRFDDPNLKYHIMASFVMCYFFTMFFGHSEFRFAFIFPPLCLLILYHSTGLLIVFSLVAVSVNVLNVLVCYFLLGMTAPAMIIRYVIQISSVCLSTLCACLASRIYYLSFEQNRIQNRRLQEITLQTIETIANTIDAKDSYTQGHSRRVAVYSVKIAEHMGLEADEIQRLRYIALLHDVGKIAVPDIVLNKPSRLTDEEFSLLRMHTSAGGDILKDISLIPDIALGARYHHERYDGKGYPDGIAGEDIPLDARIVCLADAFDAMTSNRIYRKHLSMDVVMDEIKKCRGSQFDPRCVDAFLEYLEEEGENLHLDQIDTPVIDTGFMDSNENLVDILGEQQEDNKNAAWDSLTGALNKTEGEKYLKELLKNKAGAIILINIIGLRDINSLYGYRRGDHCLKLLAKTLQDSHRKPFLSRYGGNDFLLFLPDLCAEEDIREWTRDMLERLEEAQAKDPLVEQQFSLSCAVTVHAKPEQTYEEHIDELSKVLYHIKHSEQDMEIYKSNIYGADALSREDIQDVMELILSDEKDSRINVMGETDFMHKLDNLSHITDKDFTLMLFTLKPADGQQLMPEKKANMMVLLENAMEKAMGHRENMASYSSLQRVIMLPGDTDPDTHQNDVDRIQKSILTNFYKMHNKNDVELSFHFKTVRGGGTPKS